MLNRIISPSFLRLLFGLVVTAITAYFGYLNHWQLFEQDAFWLTRAGEEILRDHAVQTTDSWSFTAKGGEWINFQWLTALLFSYVVKWGGSITALIWLRSLLTFIFFSVCGVFIWLTVRDACSDHLSDKRKNIISTLAAGVLLPVIYLISWLRFQMRPDFFGIIFFAITILLSNQLFSLGFAFRRRTIFLVFLNLILWANFHAGTVFLGIVYLSTLFLFAANTLHLRTRLVFASLFVLCWFLTPQTWHVLKVMLAATKITNNPDLQPFQLKNMLFKNSSFTYMVFAIYWSIAVSSYVFSNQIRNQLSKIYQSKVFFYFMLVFFTLLFLQRQRTIPYITLFLLPVVVTAFSQFATHSMRLAQTTWRELQDFQSYLTLFEWGHFRAWLLYSGALILIWFFMIPIQKDVNVNRGRIVSNLFMPVKCVEFIDYARPNLNLYNHFNFGGYIVYMLKDYPVYYDGRETPFLAASEERDVAARNPSTFATFLKKHNINTVLETLPQGEMVDVYEQYYPKQAWARVCSDMSSTVYVRRIYDHEVLISRYEAEGAKVQFDSPIAGDSTDSNAQGRPPKPTDAQIEQLLRDAREKLRRQEQ